MNTLKPKVKGNKVTIDELAVMINKGFIDVSRDFGKRMDQFESRIDIFEKETKNNFTIVFRKLDNLEDRVDHIEQKLDHPKVRISRS